VRLRDVISRRSSNGFYLFEVGSEWAKRVGKGKRISPGGIPPQNGNESSDEAMTSVDLHQNKKPADTGERPGRMKEEPTE